MAAENKISQREVNQIVWKACDTFRGVIDPSQYKDYILTMLFLKYVSDVHKDKYGEYLKKYKGDKERTKRAMKHERFVVPEHCSFDYLYSKRTEPNIGELINIALNDLEEANREKLGSEDGSGIFRNIDFNSSNLGDIKDKNTRLKHLLIDFSNEKLDLRPSHLQGHDIIGSAYEYLIANFASDAGKKAGEFYTPNEVSTLIARLTKSKPGARICDPTCGSGSLLIKAGQAVGSDNFSLYGQEANGSTWALAVMNMFLHGFDNSVIRWGDTIRNPKLKEGDALMKFDTVVANPPFSLDKWGADEAGADTYNRFWRGVPPKSKGDWAFITHMIETTYEGKGKVGVVVPHGVLFRGASEGKIRQKTIEENLLEAVIGLPANLFFGTGIPAAILIFSRGKGKNDKVLFIDASQHFEAGKNQNKLRESDIDQVVKTYEQFAAGKLKPGVVEDKYAYIATRKEITENEYNLNIPRYVDTFEEEAEIDIVAVQGEINKLEKELAEVQKEMNKYLLQITQDDSENFDVDTEIEKLAISTKVNKSPKVVFNVFNGPLGKLWDSLYAALAKFDKLFNESKTLHYVNSMPEQFETKVVNTLTASFTKEVSSAPKKQLIFGYDVYDWEVRTIEWRHTKYALKGVSKGVNLQVNVTAAFDLDSYSVSVAVGKKEIFTMTKSYPDGFDTTELEPAIEKLNKNILSTLKVEQHA